MHEVKVFGRGAVVVASRGVHEQISRLVGALVHGRVGGCWLGGLSESLLEVEETEKNKDLKLRQTYTRTDIKQHTDTEH